MKYLSSLLILALLLVYPVMGQKVVEKSTKVKSDQKITLDFEFSDDIKITTWDKNEVYVKATVSINDNEDNDAFELEIKEYPNSVNFISDIKNIKKLSRNFVKEDKDGNVIFSGNSYDMDITFEVKVPENAEVDVETISGNIDIIGLLGEMDIETISGDVDLSIPSNHNANLELSTISGEMYTDFDLKSEVEKGYHHYVRNDYSTKLNKGGVDIHLSSISGNIYLRKK